MKDAPAGGEEGSQSRLTASQLQTHRHSVCVCPVHLAVYTITYYTIHVSGHVFITVCVYLGYLFECIWSTFLKIQAKALWPIVSNSILCRRTDRRVAVPLAVSLPLSGAPEVLCQTVGSSAPSLDLGSPIGTASGISAGTRVTSTCHCVSLCPSARLFLSLTYLLFSVDGKRGINLHSFGWKIRNFPPGVCVC